MLCCWGEKMQAIGVLLEGFQSVLQNTWRPLSGLENLSFLSRSFIRSRSVEVYYFPALRVCKILWEHLHLKHTKSGLSNLVGSSLTKILSSSIIQVWIIIYFIIIIIAIISVLCIFLSRLLSFNPACSERSALAARLFLGAIQSAGLSFQALNGLGARVPVIWSSPLTKIFFRSPALCAPPSEAR